MTASILDASNVCFAYGPQAWVIRDMSFTVTAPRRICLLGSNGVGKSTLMLLLNGTLRPHQGQFSVLGKSVDYSRGGLQTLRRQVGIVLQDPDDQLFGATVEQDVAFGPLNNGFDSSQARVMVHETLDSLGILHLADRPIHELSLGEKKRVALAGVLVLEPKIILLDEPTAGLDAVGISTMLALLASLHRQGTTIIISTHDTDLAYEWAEEAWVLMAGRIAAQGSIREVMTQLTALQAARLRVPFVVEVALAVRDAHPELADERLPANREELVRMIHGLRLCHC